MTAWFVAAIPLLIMFFALGMERVEARLRQVAVAEKDVEEFLEQARPDEVGALFRQGIGRALELFRVRRRGPKGPTTPARPAAIAPRRSGWPGDEADTVVLPVVQAPGQRRPGPNGSMSGSVNGTINGVNSGVNGGMNAPTLPSVPRVPPRRRAS